jgi:hypothetical protein
VYSVENHAKWSAKDEWFYNFEELNRWKIKNKAMSECLITMVWPNKKLQML